MHKLYSEQALNEYIPERFWAERGKTPADRFSADKQLQISRYLDGLDFKTVLEAGCGNGELTKVLWPYINSKTYLGIDISHDRLVQHNKTFSLPVLRRDLNNCIIEDVFDLVICSHLLLHIEPEQIEPTMQKLHAATKKHLIFIEPIKGAIPQPWEYYNFEHDYFDICGRLGYDLMMRKIDSTTGIYHVEKS